MSTRDLTNELSTLSIDDFKKIIDEIAEKKSERIFKNGNAENANVVIANIFKHSDRVKSFAQSMNGIVGNCLPFYLEQVKIFLQKPNSKIEIVLEDLLEKRSDVLHYLLEQRRNGSDKIEIKKASEEFKNAIQEISVDKNKKLHFLIGDDDKFRVQYDPDKKSAYFCFNNKEITQKIDAVFQKYWSTCSVIA